MYGNLQGLMGSSILPIPQLEGKTTEESVKEFALNDPAEENLPES
jgi:hypothetical protein